MAADRYDELMARHAALTREIQERMRRHHEEMLPLLSSASQGFGTHTDGIRLAGDGSLDATLELHDVHGRTSTVVLRADPLGEVAEHGAGARAENKVSREPGTRDETTERLGIITALANEHLPVAAAQDFLALVRPALRLEHAGDGDPVVAQLGGLPSLPINSWPVWDGHGPLSHVLTFECEPVTTMLPELGLPTTGRLAFFYFDGAFDDFASPVGTWDPTTRPGFRVMHVHPERAAAHDRMHLATPAPPGLTPFPAVAMTTVRTMSWPGSESPAAESIWAKAGLVGPRPGVAAPSVVALYDALHELPHGGYDTHQIGGHACPQQNAVEMEVEQLRRGLTGEPFEWSDPAVQAVASGWQLVVQVASDDAADMMWGDVGQLYFLARSPGEPEDALLTMQCG
ncbi:YwqG family protein [Nocardioides sp. T5]|uniref:YwqG family protein n=1 Tax=Nocardioides sp. T5 TaxID=3400182 RepID=UPI003A8BE300